MQRRRAVEDLDQLVLLLLGREPGFDGQSMLPTVATHTARNSRLHGRRRAAGAGSGSLGAGGIERDQPKERDEKHA